jgi:hypothetical protein
MDFKIDWPYSSSIYTLGKTSNMKEPKALVEDFFIQDAEYLEY